MFSPESVRPQCVSGASPVPRALERRRGRVDRRATPRGGRRHADVVRVAAFLALCALAQASAAHASVKIGFDAKSIQRARDNGLPAAYASTWAGAWNQKWGWGGVEDDLRRAKAAAAVPLIQWWYWGDDISAACLDRGCLDRYHGVRKDRETWTRLSEELADRVVSILGPQSGALIVIETEFNKNGVERYEPFDGWLAEKAAFFRGKGLRVVVGFGNWGREHWKNYDRAIGAADLIGVQALLSSVRDASIYLDGAEMLISAAKYNSSAFGKPSFVTDFAFSSYPEPDYERYQDTVVRDIFRRMDELSAAGVEGMVWRMLADDPTFDPANYHGLAERHWGLLRADGSPKMAFAPFKSGMLAGRDEQSAPAASEPSVVEETTEVRRAIQRPAGQAPQRRKR